MNKHFQSYNESFYMLFIQVILGYFGYNCYRIDFVNRRLSCLHFLIIYEIFNLNCT